MRMLRIDSWSLLNTIKRLATCSLLVGQLLSLEMRQTQLSTSYLASNQNTSLYHGDLWIFCKLISKPFLFPLAYSLGYLEDNEQGWPAVRPAFPRSSALNHISLSLPEEMRCLVEVTSATTISLTTQIFFHNLYSFLLFKGLPRWLSG